MEKTNIDLPRPPINFLLALWRGVETVNAFPWMMLIPIALDALLWFGPRLSVAGLFADDQGLKEMLKSAITGASGDGQMVEALGRINLLSLLAFWPFFPPSVMAAKLPTLSPLGAPIVIPVENYPAMLGLTFLFLILSIPMGGMYWALAGRAVIRSQEPRGSLLRAWTRSMSVAAVLTIGAILILMFVVTPALMAGLLVGMVVPAAGVLVACMMSLSFCGVIWVTMIFLFSLHGAVLHEDGILPAVLNGISVLRVGPSSTVLAVLAYFLLYMLSMNVWSLPADTDWTSLLAVVGNAYLSSVIVTASLVYYDDKRRWIGEMRNLRGLTPAPQTPPTKTS